MDPRNARRRGARRPLPPLAPARLAAGGAPDGVPPLAGLMERSR